MGKTAKAAKTLSAGNVRRQEWSQRHIEKEFKQVVSSMVCVEQT